LAPFDSWMARRPAMVEVWHTRTTSWKAYILDLAGVMEMVLRLSVRCRVTFAGGWF
jgi:hypothetical protein